MGYGMNEDSKLLKILSLLQNPPPPVQIPTCRAIHCKERAIKIRHSLQEAGRDCLFVEKG